MEASLLDILDARERRVAKQKELLAQFQKPLLCFTMNIPGPVKLDRDVSIGFYVGCRLLQNALAGQSILHREAHWENTGCVAYYVVDLPAAQLKGIAIDIEQTEMIGRLFDMDVLDVDGQKLSREALGQPRRRCLLCDNDAVICARSRAHALEELQDRTGFLLYMAARQYLCEYVAVQAYFALQREVSTTPKPGLVDRNNRGAHTDMDIRHFFVSSNTLRPFFCRFAECGFLTRDLPPEETFARIRSIGMEAEKAMLDATHGVNTHKGAIFSLGILCAAAGRIDPQLWQPGHILRECAAMTAGITQRDFAGVTEHNAKTAGERLYVQYGITGIRGQAEAGFPAVLQVGLPIFQKALDRGLSPNDAGCITLLHLICAAEDTNLIKRSSRQEQLALQEQIAALLRDDPFPTMDTITALDTQFIQKNLSPGGSADLLSVTYFLHDLRK